MTPVTSGLPFPRQEADDISGAELLSVLIGTNPSEEHHILDINKKEAPRITEEPSQLDNISEELILNSSLGQLTPVNRNSRSNKPELESDNSKNRQIIDSEDLQPSSSDYYRENIADSEHVKNDLASNSFEGSINSHDDSPKIIGVRVTSSVAVGRGNKHSPLSLVSPSQAVLNGPSTGRKVKTGGFANRFVDDSPTTWRPPHFRFVNQDYYRGVPSNRHSISTLPGALVGANEDYIQQQKEREFNRKNQDSMHPYQRSFLYNNQQKESQRPRSYSYSSVVNTFGDPKHTTINDWSSSTRVETGATEATAGYVTIINHSGDNTVEPAKDNTGVETIIKENIDTKTVAVIDENISPLNVPHLPTVYSEPSKVYSEPSKVYSEPAKVYGKPEKIYSEPSKVYSEPAKVYGEPSKVYGEPSKVYGEPSKVYSEPSKVYGQPSAVYHSLTAQHTLPGAKSNENPSLTQSEQKYTQSEKNYGNKQRLLNAEEQPNKQENDTKTQGPRGRVPGEQNYEVDESVSVMTNGRTHGVQDKAAQDDGQKVGYVVEGRNFRKYRVEERTPDGFIVGEYGVVSHDDGSLRGVRYTADGTTNPRLIYDALMKFLAL